jgi:hypothetical protein
MGKECRFNELVKNSGHPEVVTLWTKPQKDPVFMRAVKENRVLTVIHQRLGSKKDYGLIGFQLQPQAAYLVFPRPLPPLTDARIIGIHYELLAERKSAAPSPRAVRSKAPKVKRKPEKQLVSFEALVRRTAVLETTVSVLARNTNEAREKAAETTRREPFDVSRAIVTNQVTAVEPES